MVMRQLLGTTLLALVLLAGCGDSDPGLLPDTDSTPGSPVPCDDGVGDCFTPTLVVSGTGGGGVVTKRATELPDDAAVTAYVKQFDDSFAVEVRKAAGEVPVPEGNTLVAAVVSIGCDEAPGVDVTRAADGSIKMTAHRVSNPTPECFAPVTTVALVGVPG
jgi:predicted small lipoprotein YifL